MFLIRTLFVLALFMSIQYSGQAQILNVERTRTLADSLGWYGETMFSGSLSQYQERILELSNTSNLSYFSNQHSYMFLNKIIILNLNGKSVISSGYAHLRGTFLRNKKLSPEIFLQYQYNKNLGLENRSLVGTGVQYTFYEHDEFTASFSTGIMAEFERWIDSNNQIIANDLIKSTSNFRLKGRISPSSTFILIGYYQFRPTRFLNPRSIVESRLNTDVTERISLSLIFTSSYDADPVIQTQKWVYSLRNGIAISF